MLGKMKQSPTDPIFTMDEVIAQEGASAVYPPAWSDSQYRVLLTRENGQWKIKALSPIK